jgi:hypothetical protein
VALIESAIIAPAMKGEPWQIRARAQGLTQKKLGRLAGKPENTISRQMRGEFGPVPGYVIALILAWESMEPPEREEWLADVEREIGKQGD